MGNNTLVRDTEMYSFSEMLWERGEDHPLVEELHQSGNRTAEAAKAAGFNVTGMDPLKDLIRPCVDRTDWRIFNLMKKRRRYRRDEEFWQDLPKDVRLRIGAMEAGARRGRKGLAQHFATHQYQHVLDMIAAPGENSHRKQKRALPYDMHLVALSVRRTCDYAGVIGRYKSERGLDTFDNEREEELMRERVMWARRAEISPETVERVFRMYVEMSRAAQEDLRGCGHFSGYI